MWISKTYRFTDTADTKEGNSDLKIKVCNILNHFCRITDSARNTVHSLCLKHTHILTHKHPVHPNSSCSSQCAWILLLVGAKGIQMSVHMSSLCFCIQDLMVYLHQQQQLMNHTLATFTGY